MDSAVTHDPDLAGSSDVGFAPSSKSERVPANDVSIGRIFEGSDGRRYWSAGTSESAKLSGIRPINSVLPYDDGDEAVDRFLRAFDIQAYPYQRRLIRDLFSW